MSYCDVIIRGFRGALSIFQRPKLFLVKQWITRIKTLKQIYDITAQLILRYCVKFSSVFLEVHHINKNGQDIVPANDFTATQAA